MIEPGRLDDVDSLFPVVTQHPEETRGVGRRLGAVLRAPVVIGLYGELGAGKTQLVKGVADGLGLDGDLVTSPTFTIVHELRKPSVLLYHVDAYRLESKTDVMDLDIEELFHAEAITVVEWPERFGDLFPTDALRIHLSHRPDGGRLIAAVVS